MPVFGFGKQRLQPHFAFAHGLLIGWRLLIGTNPLEILLSNMTIDATPLVTGRTLHFDWAVIADGSRSAIELTSVGIDYPHPLQNLVLRTAILISLRFIAEVGGRPDLIALFPIRQGNIGPDASVFQGFDVLDGAILGINRHVARPQFPLKASAKDEIAHGLVIHDFR